MYLLPAWSISILSYCNDVLFNTARIDCNIEKGVLADFFVDFETKLDGLVERMDFFPFPSSRSDVKKWKYQGVSISMLLTIYLKARQKIFTENLL
jgi:hypothetical protein